MTQFILLFVHLLDSIRILKLDYITLHNNLHDQLNYNSHYFTTVLTNKFVILTILFLQCAQMDTYTERCKQKQ